MGRRAPRDLQKTVQILPPRTPRPDPARPFCLLLRLSCPILLAQRRAPSHVLTSRPMAFPLIPLDFQGRTLPPQLTGVRDRVLALSPAEGHQALCFPDMCLYHFTHPTTLKK